MKGDFSTGTFDTDNNFNGVLHQQGRVLLDKDWNAQTATINRWQDEAGQDVIGAGVAAVPAGAGAGFKVQAAEVNTDSKVELSVEPGRVWADGLLTYLRGETAVSRVATYLQPPIQTPAHDESTIANGIRDAVVLEVWREAVNGFQMPKILIEPALGGVDTTERVHTAARFRLLRLGKGDTCRNIAARLQDDPDKLGKLKVTLQPTSITPGDCPVVEGGGYVGFEHLLYRVEIAQVNEVPDPDVMFKWSQFNGGLVGRGECDLAGSDPKITITANDQAIKMSGLTDFYLEVVEKDEKQGFWRVTYGADVTLNDDDLEVVQTHYTETLPTGKVFFRLWNGIEPIADFPKATSATEPQELRDGIRLEFDAAAGTNYRPGDFWTFEVRAGEIGNDAPLIDNKPPQGIRYHRVPLAILHWNDAQAISFDLDEIDDCRDVFQPLTNQTSCCSFTVGDGKSSFGDFDEIEEALRHLPTGGGEICLLPGVHETNVEIKGRHDIQIKGCDKKTKVIPADRAQPIFYVKDSQCIGLTHMDMVTFEGTAVILEGSEAGKLKEIEVSANRILAYKHAIRVWQGVDINIHHNKIRMVDKEGGGVAIYLLAEDAHIERNDIGVVPAGIVPPSDDPDDDNPDPTAPCVELELVYQNVVYLVAWANFVWSYVLLLDFIPTDPYKTLSGIQIGAGSKRVVVLENVVTGGAGNGITLGSDLPDPDEPEEAEPPEAVVVLVEKDAIEGEVIEGDKKVEGVALIFKEVGQSPRKMTLSDEKGEYVAKEMKPGNYYVYAATPNTNITGVEVTESAAGEQRIRVLTKTVAVTTTPGLLDESVEILIDRNEILNMGLCGIGIPQFTTKELARLVKQSYRSLSFSDQIAIGVLYKLVGVASGFVTNLTIHRNHIHHCLQNVFDEEMGQIVMKRGLGGISLGLCEKLSIRQNRIEHNGRDHVTPTCGIFVAYADQADINHNRLLNNGPLDVERREFKPGLRGGIVLKLVTSRSMEDLFGGLVDETVRARASLSEDVGLIELPSLAVAVSPVQAAVSGGHAATIHDNIVEQPFGKALFVGALGPISVLDNKFSVDFSVPGGLDVLAGAVLIMNMGLSTLIKQLLGRKQPLFARFPNGNTMFNHNQTILGFATLSITSQIIFTGDDLEFIGNQSDVTAAQILLGNTLLLAPTARASNNRLKEPIASQIYQKFMMATEG